MSLLDAFKLDPAEKEKLEPVAEKAKTLGEFFEAVGEKLDDFELPEAVAALLPWAGEALTAVGNAAAEAAPPIKFIAKLVGEITKEQDPNILARFAASMAYERSVELALAEVGAAARKIGAAKRVRQEVRELAPGLDSDFTGFSFESALVHPFIKGADDILMFYANSAGYSASQQLQLQRSVHRHFVTSLKQILAHGKTADKFRPFTSYMALETRGAAAYQLLQAHAQYLRSQYFEQPVLGKETFPLADIYVETDVGLLDWKTLAGSFKAKDPTQRIDPFVESERSGGRRIATDVVSELMGRLDVQ